MTESSQEETADGSGSALTERNPRKYGRPPFRAVVIHGGPGAPGSVALVARELSTDMGVLEPFQTAETISGQVAELKALVAENAEVPVTLIGWSWGAWLSFIFAGRYPAIVRKIILVASGAFEEKYAAAIMETRLSRLSDDERQEALSLLQVLDDPTIPERSIQFARFGALMSKADSYDPLDSADDDLECQHGIFRSIWSEARELRASGKLREMGRAIRCPVVAIHGDYDPHLAEGVEKPLSAAVQDFTFFLLKNCGHVPWNERQARDRFFEVLREELRD